MRKRKYCDGPDLKTEFNLHNYNCVMQFWSMSEMKSQDTSILQLTSIGQLK